MTAFQIPDITAFPIYVLFGAPLLMLIFGLVVVLLTRIQDRRSAKHLAEKNRAAE
jgi:hypothetical protein